MDRQTPKPGIHGKPCRNAHLEKGKEDSQGLAYNREIEGIISSTCYATIPSQTVPPSSPRMKPIGLTKKMITASVNKKMLTLL